MDTSSHSPIALTTFWPYQVTVLADQISRYTLSVAKEMAGINLSQWRVLAAVAEKPGRSAAEVTAITPMDKTIVSRAVSSLIENGLIDKTADAQDKRRSRLDTTIKGQDVYDKIAGRLNETMIKDFKNKSSHEAFVKIVESYSDAMKQLSPQRD
jgi:DNA-binding MarR family transcriptional regulator